MKFYAELKRISKSFDEVQANQDVSFAVAEGSIHALLGENGAGKSTAMKILYGMMAPSSGVISIRGHDVSTESSRKWNPERAFENGIGMVHQHFMLAQNETVLDNLVLGIERSQFGFRNRREERKKIEALMKDSGLQVPLDARVEELTIGEQSRCEILKVLYRDAQFLILDEPTAVLTPNEIEEFLTTLKKLKEQGRTILIVTHKLKEVMAIADEATVLRAGCSIGTSQISKTTIEQLSELMVGRRVVLPKVKAMSSEKLRERLSKETNAFDLSLKSGEITGIAGVEGNGQEALVSELLELCIEKKSTLLQRSELAFIPADRHKEGLVLKMSLAENLLLTRRYHPQKKSWEIIQEPRERIVGKLKHYDVRPAIPELEAQALSGGNQQKLIIAREFSGLPKNGVLLAVHPTRGVDLGAIEFIHREIIQAAENGVAVLLVSSELDELMSLSHRIGVMYKQKIVQWFDRDFQNLEHPYDEFKLGRVMLTGREVSA